MFARFDLRSFVACIALLAVAARAVIAQPHSDEQLTAKLLLTKEMKLQRAEQLNERVPEQHDAGEVIKPYGKGYSVWVAVFGTWIAETFFDDIVADMERRSAAFAAAMRNAAARLQLRTQHIQNMTTRARDTADELAAATSPIGFSRPEISFNGAYLAQYYMYVGDAVTVRTYIVPYKAGGDVTTALGLAQQFGPLVPQQTLNDVLPVLRATLNKGYNVFRGQLLARSISEWLTYVGNYADYQAWLGSPNPSIHINAGELAPRPAGFAIVQMTPSANSQSILAVDPNGRARWGGGEWLFRAIAPGEVNFTAVIRDPTILVPGGHIAVTARVVVRARDKQGPPVSAIPPNGAASPPVAARPFQLPQPLVPRPAQPPAPQQAPSAYNAPAGCQQPGPQCVFHAPNGATGQGVMMCGVCVFNEPKGGGLPPRFN